ncbi:hypothetical protein BH23ACT9_BH23ACT9_17350 [soil metagenome]
MQPFPWVCDHGDVGEAATFLELPPSTLRRWLLGDVRKGRRYLPVLRDENNDDPTVRWGEFIEAGVLKALRGEHKVDLQELRVFCHTLRHTEGLPYPLAMKEILLNGPRLLYPLRLANIEALVDADASQGGMTGPGGGSSMRTCSAWPCSSCAPRTPHGSTRSASWPAGTS